MRILPRQARGVQPRAGKFVGPADGSGVGKYAGHRLRYVFHIDWLQTRTTAPYQRQNREQPGEVGECAKQRVARTEHGTRADDGGIWKRLLDCQFASPRGRM